MATGLTKKQKEALTDKITGLIKSSPALRMTTDSSVNELNINQISGELNRIHYRAIGKDLPAVFSFEPKQLGSGDPSPDNIRPIVGYEIDGIGTVYGGELNIDTSVLTVTYGGVDMGTLNWSYYSSTAHFYVTISTSKTTGSNFICSEYTYYGTAEASAMTDKATGLYRFGNIFRIKDTSYTNAATFKAAMSGAMLVYELATPETYTLTPQQMLQLLDQI